MAANPDFTNLGRISVRCLEEKTGHSGRKGRTRKSKPKKGPRPSQRKLKGIARLQRMTRVNELLAVLDGSGMGEGELFGYAEPLTVAKDPDIGKAFITMSGLAIFVLQGDVVETRGDDTIVGYCVGNQEGHV